MTSLSRLRRISELILRFKPTEIKGRWHVLDIETGKLLERADYDSDDLARAKCRQETAVEIERLYGNPD
jgi:hypothetical protein